MKKGKDTTPMQGSPQVDEFLIGIMVLNRVVDEFRHFYLESVLPEELPDFIEHLERICHSGRASRRIDNLDFFCTICLVLSGERGPLTMGEIGQAINVPLSSATRIVDWMTDGGYVTRFTDPDDRRVVRVMLTDMGREVFRVIYAFMCSKANQILRHFTDEEKEIMISLIDRFSKILTSEKKKEATARMAPPRRQ